jgi:hypothetical protein
MNSCYDKPSKSLNLKPVLLNLSYSFFVSLILGISAQYIIVKFVSMTLKLSILANIRPQASLRLRRQPWRLRAAELGNALLLATHGNDAIYALGEELAQLVARQAGDDARDEEAGGVNGRRPGTAILFACGLSATLTSGH